MREREWESRGLGSVKKIACRWEWYLLVGNRSGIDQDSKWMRVKKKKRYSFTHNCESASGGRPQVGPWISTASLGAPLEVAEVVQGVDFSLTTLRYFSRGDANTSEDPIGGTLGTNRGGQPIYSCEEQLGWRIPLHLLTLPPGKVQ